MSYKMIGIGPIFILVIIITVKKKILHHNGHKTWQFIVYIFFSDYQQSYVVTVKKKKNSAFPTLEPFPHQNPSFSHHTRTHPSILFLYSISPHISLFFLCSISRHTSSLRRSSWTNGQSSCHHHSMHHRRSPSLTQSPSQPLPHATTIVAPQSGESGLYFEMWLLCWFVFKICGLFNFVWLKIQFFLWNFRK